MSAVPVLGSAVPSRVLAAVTGELQARLDFPVRLEPWREMRNRSGAPSSHGGILILAPHELSDQDRAAVLRPPAWSWVHLTSAGADFLARCPVPPGTLVTRSWRCYAAPLAEYAVHAVLSHEWGQAAPWRQPDERPLPAPGSPPVPAGAARDPGAGLWRCEVGVAGWGETGRRVAGVLADLGARVRVLSRSPKPATHPEIRHTTTLTDVLDGDHLVIALPWLPQTRGLFGAEALQRARPGLHIVNVSRGELIDQGELTRLCATGRLAATLDVTTPERLPADHPLRALPSVRLSPHIAWRSRQSDLAFVDDFTAIWSALKEGVEVPGVVQAGDLARARAAIREMVP